MENYQNHLDQNHMCQQGCILDITTADTSTTYRTPGADSTLGYRDEVTVWYLVISWSG